MIVVSDTSSVSALLHIGPCDLLERLYGRVIIPEAVESELRRRFDSLPDFLHCEQVSDNNEVKRFSKELDLGEAEAIVLARETHADILLMDELKGRAVALREGIPLIGLIGVLLQAKRNGLVPSVRRLIDRLEAEAKFRISTEIKRTAIESAGEL